MKIESSVSVVGAPPSKVSVEKWGRYPVLGRHEGGITGKITYAWFQSPNSAVVLANEFNPDAAGKALVNCDASAYSVVFEKMHFKLTLGKAGPKTSGGCILGEAQRTLQGAYTPVLARHANTGQLWTLFAAGIGREFGTRTSPDSSTKFRDSGISDSFFPLNNGDKFSVEVRDGKLFATPVEESPAPQTAATCTDYPFLTIFDGVHYVLFSSKEGPAIYLTGANAGTIRSVTRPELYSVVYSVEFDVHPPKWPA